jgi:hypothetical protein
MVMLLKDSSPRNMLGDFMRGNSAFAGETLRARIALPGPKGA